MFPSVTLSAQGEVATNYLQLRGIDFQRTLFDEPITSYRRALTIATNKYNAGTVVRSDVYQAQTSLSNAIASRQELDRQRAVLEHAVAVLVGENPSTFGIAQVPWNAYVPEMPFVVPRSMPKRLPTISTRRELSTILR